MSSGFNDFIVEREHNILHVWINRPESRNAFTMETNGEWDQILDLAEHDTGTRVVTVRGKGPVFSAGHDLKEVARWFGHGGSPTSPPGWEQAQPSLPRAWYFPKTIIAGVHGYVGPAAQRFLAPIDFIIAARGTRFSFEQARLGSGDPGGNILAFQLPMRVIKQMWLMGGWFDAETASQMHYVQRVVDQEQLDAEVQQWAASAAEIDPAQVAVFKEGIRRIYEIQGLLGVIGYGNRHSAHGSAQDNAFFETLVTSGMKEALKLRQADVDPTVTEIR